MLLALLLGLASAPAWSAGAVFHTPYDAKQRFACQTVIEDLNWSHRIWPEHNQDPKPPRSEVLGDAAIAAMIDTSLRREMALAGRYGIQIDDRKLQIELNRMAASTKAPDRLQQLFDALGNDARAIAECVARPALVERYLRQAYADDASLHGELRARAEAALEDQEDIDALRQAGAEVSEFSYVLRDEVEAALLAATADENNRREGYAHEIGLLAEDFQRERIRLNALTPEHKAIPRDLIEAAHQPLRDSGSTFVFERVLAQADNRIDVVAASWTKQAYESWWSGEAQNWTAGARGGKRVKLELPTIGGSGADLNKAAADTWRAETGQTPDGRHGHTAVWTGSEMIVWGGSNASHFNTGGRYDPTSDTWLATSREGAPSPRIGHTAVWTGSEMIVWGGHNESASLGTGGRYDPTKDIWTTTTMDGAPSLRNGHTAVWTGNEMIVWGGDWPGVNTGGRYVPATNAWLAIAVDGAPSPRLQHTAVWTGSEMIVWGGYFESEELNTGGRYSPSTNTWMATSVDAAPSQRYWHTAVWTGSEMVVWGGYDGSNELNSGQRYTPASDTWTAISADGAPSVRRLHTAVWTGNEMIVWGGYDGTATLNSGRRYVPLTDTWLATQSAGAPSPRSSHSAVWTGSEMIVWGGWGGSGVLSSGGRHAPATDTWSASSIGTAPSARVEHSAIWTGSEMIVWGGFNSVRLNTGGRYTPATDTWIAISLVDAPSERRDATAVWSGSEMIVWGSAELNTGGRYSPATDTWVATSLEGAPSYRNAHTAVWTGSEMIVWGGSNSDFSTQGTGGRYNPQTDTWIALSTVGAPWHSEHTAVWTGGEMIVWGGWSGTGLSTTGGRYDPTTDTWGSISTNGAPSPRYDHTAVWTGSEMLVWGGNAGFYGLNSGGRYDPKTDSWIATPTLGAPIQRVWHTAVWTGNEMIVWGGQDYGGLDTGGRYSPETNTWIATATAGAPSARAHHSAVWTGGEMIVWGGGCCLNSSGAYSPYATISLSYISGSNGSIEGPALQTVAIGHDGHPVAAVPDDGYAFLQWSDSSTANPRQDLAVSRDNEVEASFSLKQYNVTASSDGSGTITPPLQVIDHGSDASFSIAPDAIHHFESVTGDSCDPIDTGGGIWVAEDIMADCAVTATFAIDTYTVSGETLGGGSITPQMQEVEHGGVAELTVEANQGHDISSVIGDTCNPTNAGGSSWTATNIVEPCTVTASFFGTHADLQIAKDNGVAAALVGQTVVYAITVANAGPLDVVGASISDVLPASLIDASWACLPDASDTPCPPAPFDAGSGDLISVVDLPAGRYLRFDLMATVQGGKGSLISNSASVTSPQDVPDSDLSNNSATDHTLIVPEGIFVNGFEPQAATLTIPAAARAQRDRGDGHCRNAGACAK